MSWGEESVEMASRKEGEETRRATDTNKQHRHHASAAQRGNDLRIRSRRTRKKEPCAGNSGGRRLAGREGKAGGRGKAYEQEIVCPVSLLLNQEY